MSEQWEKVIEIEFDLFANSERHYQELQEMYDENELNIQYPVTRFDEIEGRVYRSCPGTEEQALRRIEIRERIQAAMNQIDKRINRLLTAYKQLDETDQDILSCFYIERDMPDIQIKNELGFKTVRDLHQSKQKALRKMYEIYKKQREESDREHKAFLKEIREEKARMWKQQIKKSFEEREFKQQQKLSIFKEA